MSTLICPCCHAQMREATIGAIKIHECPECRGAWLHDEELRLAKDQTDHDLVWLDFNIWKHQELFRLGSRSLSCPACHSRLVQIHYDTTSATIDYCKSCRGIWLDRGEFDRIIRALETEVSGMNAAEYLKASLAEAKELLTGPESFLSEWRDLKAVLRLLEIRLCVEHQGFTDFLRTMPLIG